MKTILKNKKLIKLVLFSIISVLIIMIIIKTNIKIKKYETEEVKVNLEVEERSAYPKTEGLWGTLEIKSLKINSNIYKGNEEYLKYGLLHHKESYFPTDGKTIIITGNNKYLKNISEIKVNDKITLKTVYGTYNYIVEKTEIKNAKKLSRELEINDNEELIIYTTYPEVKGYKSDRFVVYAKRGDNK